MFSIETRSVENPALSNSPGLKRVFDEKLRFCDGLMKTVGLAIEIKLCFQTHQALYGRGRILHKCPDSVFDLLTACVSEAYV